MLRGVLTLKVRLIVLGVALLAGALVVVLVVVMAVFGSASGASATSCVPTNEVPDAPSGAASEQVDNARTIDRTAEKLGLSGKASRIAIIAAIGESSLVNLGYGDEGQGVTNPDGSATDSKGLFQQQPSQGWGTVQQVMDPEYATTSFLTGKKHDGKGGLVAVPNWESIEATVAIHKVQINADPNHYARYYSQADKIIAEAGIDVSRPGSDSASVAPVDGATAGTDTAAGCSTGDAPTGSAGKGVQPLDLPYNESSGYGPRNSPVAGASSWHPALDLVGTCGQTIYAALPGTVTVSDRLWLSIKSPEGFTVSYLHSHKSDRSVDVGQTVKAGQAISKVGDEAPATGCHLDFRVNVTGNTNPDVAALPVSSVVPGFVDPAAFMKLYGVELCPAATCRKTY